MKSTFLSSFTPSLMTPETLEAIFVQRHQLADYLVELIRESTLTANKHFRLLVGMRGIGKTHLVALIYHRVSKMNDLREKLLIAWLREEEWGITSFLDLLVRIFRALKKEYLTEYDAKLNEKVEALYQLPPDEAEYRAATLLREFVGKRTLLLLVENLDDLFDGLGDIGQKQLRAYLQNYSFCTILATAQSLFDGVRLQDYPFYGFFCPHDLEDLKLNEAVNLLTNIAKLEGNKKLEYFIQTPTGRARIQTIHHLAGGNHRVYVIFSQFLTCKSLDELVEPFMQMLDDLTPYYQARMTWLSQQQRKIVEFVCDRRHAVTVKEIAQRCFITHQTASSQLKSLREMGYVISEAIGRESYYELREPLMRFCIELKKQRGEPIRLFVDFLRIWYSRTELQQRLELLPPDAALEREYLLHALWAAEEEGEDPRLAAYLKDFEAYLDKKDLVHALQVVEKLVTIRGHQEEWIGRGCCLSMLERDDEALTSFNKAIELNPDNALAWCIRNLTLFALDRHDEALTSSNKAIELNPDNALAWYIRSNVLFALERYDEALAFFNKTIELDPNNVNAWDYRGGILGILGHDDEALASFDKVIELDSNYASAWGMQGAVLYYFKERYKEALVFSNKATELGEPSPYVFLIRAESLLALNQWDEGTVALDEALHRFAHAHELYTGDTQTIIRNLFNSTPDEAMWRSRIKTLIEIYEKHQVASELRQGLVRSIPILMSEMVSNTAGRTWLEVWRELVSTRTDFQIPLRLLNAAVRYRETKGDPRVLLELPIEERNLLKPLLGIEKA